MGLSVEPPSHVALITNPSRHGGAAIMTSALPLFISHGAHGIDCAIGAACCMFCILECIFSAEDFHEPQGSGDERMAGRVGQIMDAKSNFHPARAQCTLSWLFLVLERGIAHLFLPGLPMVRSIFVGLVCQSCKQL